MMEVEVLNPLSDQKCQSKEISDKKPRNLN